MQRIAIGIWLAATATACTVEGDADEPTEPEGFAAEPLASIETASGLTVDFYEPAPGALMVMQSAEVGVTPLRASRPVDVYRALAPGRPVPEALMLAQARSDELAGVDDESAARITHPQDILPSSALALGYINNQSCDDHWFDDEFCFGADWSMCLLNHWNGAYAQSGGVNFAQYATCADIGNITLKVTMGGSGGGIWSVLEGHYRTYYWSNIWSESSTRGDILNATNNRFHYAVQYLD